MSTFAHLLFPADLSTTRFVCRRCLGRQIKLCRDPLRRPILTSRRGKHDLQRQSADPGATIPFRKQLKEEAKKKKLSGQPKQIKKVLSGGDGIEEPWELTVGIEIHAQLNVEKKLFSSASSSINDQPNTHVALFDAALPGAQPEFQKRVLLPAIRAALALNCSVQRSSRFDRKHYFYWDQPNGYQITQYYEPLAKDGHIILYDHDGIAKEDGESITVGIKQIQLEQDTAKTNSQPPSTQLLDFNRVSHPLIEIISLPHMHHPSTAAAYVRKIQATLEAVSSCIIGMELGGLRADVNVSVRRRGSSEGGSHQYHGVTGLGQRTEIKNLSSFKAVEDAIIAERNRQIRVIEDGGTVEGETRGWTLGSTETTRLRGKEGEVDYRYMPDPDILPLLIGQDLIDHLHRTLPMSPDENVKLLTEPDTYGLILKDAKTLVNLDDGERLDYYQDVVEQARALLESQDDEILKKVGRMAGNWVIHELGGLLTISETSWKHNPVTSDDIASILQHVLEKKITGSTAKQLLAKKFTQDHRSIPEIIEEENLLLRPMSTEEYEELANMVMEGNESIIDQIKQKGQMGKIMHFVGQMMRKGEEGRVEAKRAEETVRRLLEV